jgi:predicted nucleic acid-binding protein
MATMPAEAPAEPLFVDTNVWLYATDPASPFHTRALKALDTAQDRGTPLITSPQILREYLAVGTRPGVIAAGPSLADLLANVADIRMRCRLVDETEAVVDRLAALLDRIPTAYRRVHDANIVATMVTWNVSQLLTHNGAGFTLYRHLVAVVPLP